ncbi:hypothetical protein ETAA8_04730 [Anatilimnocola aggregata]|uniref:Uncharacterized protein n=1 Tax=Anatilimnocola aggregata TaxID=2528021 RepID=A0A517Y598_9BACT|nr:hypothetical protein ETAA8_04730 [Anatilimnocola aggregata]
MLTRHGEVMSTTRAASTLTANEQTCLTRTNLTSLLPTSIEHTSRVSDSRGNLCQGTSRKRGDQWRGKPTMKCDPNF